MDRFARKNAKIEVIYLSQDLNKKIGKATAWSSLTEIISKLVLPIVNIVLARLLLPEAFGIVATITMVISFAEVFTDAGFQKYIVQHEFENEEALDKSTNVAFWSNFTLSFLICTLIFFFRDKLAELVGNPGLGNSISIASILIIIAAFSSIQMARYKRDFDFKTLFFVRIGTSLIPLVITLPLAFVLRNYWALLIGNFASQLFSATVLTIKSKWKPKFYYSFKLFKEMFSFSAWTLLESIVIWLTLNIDIFILGNMLDDYYLGIYKTSMTTVNSYMSIITAAIVPVLFSTLSRQQNDKESFRTTFYIFQKYTSILVLPMSVGIFIFSDLVVKILLGSQWGEAVGFVGLWGLMSGITIIFSHFASEVYRSKGNPRISTFAQLLHIAFLIPTVIITKEHSFTVLYVSRSLMRLQFIVVNLIIMRVVYKFKLTQTIKNILPAVISTVVMSIIGYLLKNIMTAVWWQVVSVLICIIVYFTVLLLCFPKVRREITSSEYYLKIKRKLKIGKKSETN